MTELKENNTTLCLNMIVKNESRIITRLLESVLPIIDCYCICDTGSTDNTISIIQEFFKNKKITGKIVQEPFKNFCYNRNFALQSCLGMSDYIIFLDADMVLQINDFNKNKLGKADSYMILQGNDSFSYQNMRIIRNNGLYKYIGVTHEYIETPKNNISSDFKKSEVFILDIGDGGSKKDKFERDILLLLDGIKECPNDARYHFYLANSYHDSGKFSEAIPFYLKRIEFGGWIEEVWYSYYRIGLCYKNMNRLKDAIHYWLEGYNYYPDRLEGIYEIIYCYRTNSKHRLCELYYKVAKNILNKKYNRDKYLFCKNDIYTYKLYFEYTIFSAYVGVKNINDEIVTICNQTTNDTDISTLLSNMKFYKHILEPVKTITFNDKIKYILNEEPIEFNSSSSCLIKNPLNSDSYCMNIRYVNYFIENDGRYSNCEKHIISLNKFIELDKKFNPKREFFMPLNFDARLYIGIEDIKLFYDKYQNNLLCIGTNYTKNNKISVTSGKYNYLNQNIESNDLKQYFKHTNCEKNWVFVDYKNYIHIIYEWFPLKLCKLKDSELYVVEVKQMPKIFSRVRGSSCGFHYKNELETEIWFISHIVSYETPRHYYHIISVFDINMNLLRYSAPFKFEGDPIEYSLSIVVENDRVLINYSNWDRTTKIGIYDKKYIDSLIKYFI